MEIDRADDSIAISALQHFLFCPRQCALIHLEQIWTENALTAEGRVLHARADEPRQQNRRGVRVVTAMPLHHPELGIHGVADVVEFNGEEVTPVEYKRGKPKRHRADEVQLCAQALCLELMLSCAIPAGALYYGEPRRRQHVAFDSGLRALTLQVIQDVRAMMLSRQTPPAQYERARCDRCSLFDDCQPKTMGRKVSVLQWLGAQLKD
jgi:CRISPR-associated exonuclease Cas4